MSDDLAALAAFGVGADASGGKGTESSEPARKRVCLTHDDLVPAQRLNPRGMSGNEKNTLPQLWEHCKKGTKAAEEDVRAPEEDECAAALARGSNLKSNCSSSTRSDDLLGLLGVWPDVWPDD
jgi:hypothetical protein